MSGLKQLLEERERQLIAAALQEAEGHQRRAAALLGVLPSTLCEKMKRLGIPGRTARDVVDDAGFSGSV
jgi:DNA-binding NtrC family response regulator